jgi:hypothetical protein
MYKAFIKNPAYKSVNTSTVVSKVEEEKKKPTVLSFIKNWFL